MLITNKENLALFRTKYHLEMKTEKDIEDLKANCGDRRGQKGSIHEQDEITSSRSKNKERKMTIEDK